MRAHGSMLSSVAALAKNERRAVVAEFTEMVKHERKVTASAALAASAGRPDPSAPDLLQGVAAEDTATVTALLVLAHGFGNVVQAASCADGDVRATSRAADTGGSSHAYIFDGRPGGASNSRTAPSGQ